MDKTEDQFVQAIKENEQTIFKVTTIYAIDSNDQKDLYQDIVGQPWRAFKNFREESGLNTWIYRIALNTAITRLRKQKKTGQNVPIDQVVLDYAEVQEPEFEHEIKILYQCIDSLNPMDKGIILLYLENKRHEEISKIIGISVSNVGTRISRIRLKLKSQIKTQNNI